MPHKSYKEKLIDSLINEAAEEIMDIEGIENDDEAVDSILDDLVENLFVVMECRRIMYTIPKSHNSRNDIFATMDDDRFLQMFRVDRDEFMMLVELIKNDEEFNKAHSCKQSSVELQLAITLFRLGATGESGKYRNIMTIFDVGSGTITKTTKRIFKVFLRLQSKYIYWPDVSERAKIVSDTFDELPGCIGYIDGTEIKLTEPPADDHTSSDDRNNINSMKAQVVCDYKQVIRHVVVGQPGTWHDSRIYQNSSLFKQAEQYFSSQQWIAGDTSYPLSGTLITPYRKNEQKLNRDAQNAFNALHSKYRVRVEHCIALLKGRFESLKQLRIRFSNIESHKFGCDWFLVCCILHNILINNGSSSFEGILDSTVIADNSMEPDDFTHNSFGEIQREAVRSLMFS